MDKWQEYELFKQTLKDLMPEEYEKAIREWLKKRELMNEVKLAGVGKAI
jgi:hypothetical protein